MPTHALTLCSEATMQIPGCIIIQLDEVFHRQTHHPRADIIVGADTVDLDFDDDAHTEGKIESSGGRHHPVGYISAFPLNWKMVDH